MWQKILPRQLNSERPGNPVALWLFCLVTAVTVGRSLAHILLPDGGAQSIATVPLDQFSGEGAAAVITQFRTVGSLPTAPLSGHGTGCGSLPWADSCHVLINFGGIPGPRGHRSRQATPNTGNTAGRQGQSVFHCCRNDRSNAVLS